MTDGYIHGFSTEEQERLFAQARVLASGVFRGWDLSGVSSLLEIGCGVGAELEIIHERWPQVTLTGVDRSEAHLAAGRRRLPRDINLVRGDATALPFEDKTFDRAITIWMLEHVPDPVAVVREALRVLKPGGRLVCTEVDNHTFQFSPRIDPIMDWWDSFNRFQQDRGGDPFVGAKLGDIAKRAGAKNIRVEAEEHIDSKREPDRRRIWLDYVEELLLSGAENLIAHRYATEADRSNLRKAFETLRSRPDVNFTYFGMRLTCSP